MLSLARMRMVGEEVGGCRGRMRIGRRLIGRVRVRGGAGRRVGRGVGCWAVGVGVGVGVRLLDEGRGGVGENVGFVVMYGDV